MIRDRLSKSAFVRGMQCEKSLHLNRYSPELRDTPDRDRDHVFEQGNRVGNLARRLFPGGISADEKPERNQVEYTAELIEQGQNVIYEAAFFAAGVYCAVDILVRQGSGWHVIEVKSSTSVHDVYLTDAALQYFVLKHAGLRISEFSIAYMDRTYVRSDELDVQRLFRVESVLAECRENAEVSADVDRLRNVLRKHQAPEVDIGEHCRNPYPCDFWGHCTRHIPEDSIFQLTRVRKSRLFSFYYDGILRLDDLPEDSFSGHAAIQLAAHKLGEPIVDRERIGGFLQSLQFPLQYMDFETIFPAVPRFKESRPYQQIPFQFCVGVQRSGESEPIWEEFLAEGGDDPRTIFAERLLGALPNEGTILVYNKSFEISRLRELAAHLPAFADAIHEVIDRIRDLMDVFRNGGYYHPDMHGSYSMKAVLPAVAPDMDYADLMIQDGGMASQAFEALLDGQVSNEAELRTAMVQYCRRDTEGMYLIWQHLCRLTLEENYD